MFVILIATLHIGSFVYVLTQLDKNHLFSKDPNKTIMLLWVEISIVSVPIKIVYYIYTGQTLLMFKRKKRENLNNPDIKEAICEGVGL